MSADQYLPIERIRIDGGTQARQGLDEATVADYAEAWLTLSHTQNGLLAMPPIVVFHDGESYWLADGFHRVSAYQQFLDGRSASASPRAIRADVRMGTQRDAMLYACGANDTHGLRRSRADVQRAIETLLRDSEWGAWSDRALAERVHCHHSTVSTVRERLIASGEISQIETRTVERGGTTYQQKPPQPAAPDLPIDFSIVQRRLAAHGVTLSSKDGMFTTFTAGKATGISTPTWRNVTDRLERLEDQADYDAEHSAVVEDRATNTPAADRLIYAAKEARDDGRLERATRLIAEGESDAAHTVLAQIEVSTWKRDQLLEKAPLAAAGRQITLAFTPAECLALLKEARMFADSIFGREFPTIGKALILVVEGIKGVKLPEDPHDG